MSPAKTAKQIDLLIRGQTLVAPRNHLLDGGSDPRGKGAILGVVQPIEKHC